MITRKQKKELLVKIRDYTSTILQEIIKVKQDYTGKELAQKIGLDASRISEIIAANPKPLSESTLRKLVGGGIIKASDIVANINPTKEEAGYLRKFLAYENGKLTKGVDLLSQYGYDAADLLGKLATLAREGIDLNTILREEEEPDQSNPDNLPDEEQLAMFRRMEADLPRLIKMNQALPCMKPSRSKR